MNGAFFSLRADSWPLANLKLVVLSWLVSEILVFALAVKVLGFSGTLLLMLATSVLGATILRRAGLEAAHRLRRTMGGGGTPNEAFVDGSLTVLGGMLLILPGFVSDAMGLVLATPSVRQGLASRFLKRTDAPSSPAMGRNIRPDVIDLAPEDWRVVDKTTRS